ncbi:MULTISPECIES: Fis family transcriptional regulator [Salinivibrio]|uniref:Fis family transcriptional regulator n=2 Tax=Salinivibrio TaxID=51366 RepID=A0ABY7LHM8_9GAMM|nr:MULTISPECIES: Fis family transcriptional regulator [Salinivibrio]QIR06019.1 Fis family transcriptional regulator [Salinivibrio costicola]WBA15911.1 Fis family transcriptional regulator [Salinivibrio proteolyticus]
MRKTDKKYDKAIREALTEVCELTMENIEGFEWLTHEVNYQRFPQSLIVRLMFKDQQTLASFKRSDDYQAVLNDIQTRLTAAGVTLKNINQHIELDTL